MLHSATMSIDWAAFSPLSAAIGGVIIGVAVAMLVLLNGRVAGISGIVGGLLRPAPGDVVWRLAFIAGLVAAPLFFSAMGKPPSVVIDAGFPLLAVAGF